MKLSMFLAALMAIGLGSWPPSALAQGSIADTQMEVSTAVVQSSLTLEAIKRAGPIASSYLLYRVVSNDSVHCSVTSVLSHFDVDGLKDNGAGYLLGPFGSDKIELNLDNLVLIATGIGVGFTNIVGDGDGNRAIASLCERYGALRAKATAP